MKNLLAKCFGALVIAAVISLSIIGLAGLAATAHAGDLSFEVGWFPQSLTKISTGESVDTMCLVSSDAAMVAENFPIEGINFEVGPIILDLQIEIEGKVYTLRNSACFLTDDFTLFIAEYPELGVGPEEIIKRSVFEGKKVGI